MKISKIRIAFAALAVALTVGAVGTSYAFGTSAPPSGSGTLTAAAAGLPKGAPLKISLVGQDDPEAMGACIHSVSSARMCNEVTHRFCFSAMWIRANFYEGYTCDQAKSEGLY